LNVLCKINIYENNAVQFFYETKFLNSNLFEVVKQFGQLICPFVCTEKLTVGKKNASKIAVGKN